MNYSVYWKDTGEVFAQFKFWIDAKKFADNYFGDKVGISKGVTWREKDTTPPVLGIPGTKHYFD